MRARSIRSSPKPIAITTGDHRGIGAEVIAKGLHQCMGRSLNVRDVVIFGDPELYRPFQKFLPKVWHCTDERGVLLDGHLNFVLPSTKTIAKNKRPAFLCGRYVELATLGAISGKYSALVTGPIDKNELHAGGYPFDGHTELLKKLCRSKSVTMMMAGPQLRTTLVSVHEALRDVSKKLTQEKILVCLENSITGLKRDFGIAKPKIAVLGLNPHASDQGLFGDEERKIIEPAISEAKKRWPRVTINGPFASDGFFAQWRTRHSKNFDAVVCMYHDQGLIPAKLLDFENTVNVTLGLPIVRTSVDHGVGYDIAGKNKADPASFIAALALAQAITIQRTRRLK